YSAELNRVKNQKQYKETGNEGDLGYFTAFSMVYPFEKAVYAMKVGDISMPIRTQYGYHIIQLTDKKPALGSIKAAHILVPITVFDTTPEQKSACRAKIDEAYAKLQSGTSFEEVAKEYSKDNASSKGGYLGEFTVNRMIPEFIEAFYKMKPGEYSKPIQTRFVWNILHFISNRSIESYLAVLPNLEYNISKDERSTLPIKVYASKLMKNNNLKENTAVLFSFQALIKDTILKAGHWVYDSLSNPKIYSQVLFSYGNNKVYLSDFARYMEEKQQQTLKGKAQIIGEMYGEFKISYSLQNEAKMLDSKYPEFKALMKEYRDGVYLFDINNRKVWAKASNDTVALRKYFEDHKDQYKWPHKVDAVVVSYDVKTVSTDQMRKCMEKAYKKNWSVEQIRAQMDKSFGIDVIKVEENTFEPGSNIFVDNTPWVLGLSKDILSGDTRKAFVIIEKIIPESYKDFS
ncbi:MAG: peptidylprolyl isomerase, partial [Bacteroidales bacterium]